MNTQINLSNLSEIKSLDLVQLPVEHIPRNEKCPSCEVSLIETFRRESSMPKDIMKVQIGRKYSSWLVSGDIFCPKCKMLFKHEGTDSSVLGRYEAIAKDGGIYKLKLEDDFLISRFDTSLKKNLKKGTIVYATIGAVVFSRQRVQIYKVLSASSFSGDSLVTNFLYEIEEGYKKSDGWTKGEISIRKSSLWKQVPAVLCVLKAIDLFTSDSWIALPARIFTLPKVVEKANG